jgi:hypothetical protein
METQTTKKNINTFSISDKDTVRTQEQRHESLLKKRLLEIVIVVDFDKISHHGFHGIKKLKENK